VGYNDAVTLMQRKIRPIGWNTRGRNIKARLTGEIPDHWIMGEQVGDSLTAVGKVRNISHGLHERRVERGAIAVRTPFRNFVTFQFGMKSKLSRLSRYESGG
jgi:hypothetical protein